MQWSERDSARGLCVRGGGGLTRDRTAIVRKNRTHSATARHSTNTNLSACDTGRYPMNRNREREQKQKQKRSKTMETRIKPKQITNDSRHSTNVPVSTKPAWAVERMHCSGLLMLVEGRKEGGRKRNGRRALYHAHSRPR
jgi:hypothetical protein